MLVEEETEQYFDEKAKQFLADRYIKGKCPKCDHDDAYGDQCENCGSTLSPLELIDPVSTLTNEKPILKKTKHWYLPLDKYESWLRNYIMDGTLDGEEHHKANLYREMLRIGLWLVIRQKKSLMNHHTDLLLNR